MKRFTVVLLIVVFVFLFTSCVDYSAIGKQEAQEVMAQQKEAQEEREILEKVEKLEKENEEQLKNIDEITKRNEELESDYDKIASDHQEFKRDTDKYRDDLSETLELLDNSRKLNEFFKNIIISDSIMKNELTFEYVDVLSVNYSAMDGTSITFDRVKTEYLERGYNPLSTFVIDDEAYFDDESYDNERIKEEMMDVSEKAYVHINGLESYGFNDKAARYLNQIVEVPQEEIDIYDWYIEDKKPDTDSDGNEIVEKRIYFVGIIDNDIVMLMEREVK